MQKPKISLLTLGTAQLGLSYGIANFQGMPVQEEVFRILALAIDQGITSWDTASTYGQSESRIGAFLEKHPEYIPNLWIGTKIASLSKEKTLSERVEDNIHRSINASIVSMGLPQLSLAMLHDFHDILRYQAEIVQAFHQAQEKGKILHAGISVYEPQEAEYLLKKTKAIEPIRSIQIPLNLFDHRFLRNQLLQRMKDQGWTIYARSIYLQGFFFLSKEILPEKLRNATPYLKKLQEMTIEYGCSIQQLAMAFVAQFREIDSVLIGVEREEQLKKNIQVWNTLHKVPSLAIHKQKEVFSDIPTNIIDPRQW